jgi:hypothetical protein
MPVDTIPAHLHVLSSHPACSSTTSSRETTIGFQSIGQVETVDGNLTLEAEFEPCRDFASDNYLIHFSIIARSLIYACPKPERHCTQEPCFKNAAHMYAIAQHESLLPFR